MQRYLGIELGGSRSHRTTLVALDYFPEMEKIFVSAILKNFQETKDTSSDATLLTQIHEQKACAIGMHAPLTLPPCVTCRLVHCPTMEKCKIKSVTWMRKEAKKRKKSALPYVQRPVDLWLRHEFSESFLPLDETMGAGRAPLAVRMQYIQRHVSAPLLEVIPRLTLLRIAPWFGISKREVRKSREWEDGLEIRFGILEKLGKKIGIPHLFLYQTDLQSLAKDLSSFDALLSALMPLYETLQLLDPPPLDPKWGQIAVPKKMIKNRESGHWQGAE